MMGMGEKKKSNEIKEKIPRLVAFPSPPHVYEMWKPAVFRCRKIPKTSRTRWAWGSSLVGQRNTGLGAEWDNKKKAGNMIFYVHGNFQGLQ